MSSRPRPRPAARPRRISLAVAALFLMTLGVEQCPELEQAEEVLVGSETPAAVTTASMARTTDIYRPTGWRFTVPDLPAGNAFDQEATAVFRHDETGEVIRTRFFFDGGDSWVLRFTGTIAGSWTGTTSSAIAELHGLRLTVQVEENAAQPGFITHIGNRWGRVGTGEVYVPNFLMWYGPGDLADDPSRIDEAIEVFFEGHGFNGLHLVVINEWFEIGSARTFEHSSRDPDPRTFRILERLINRVYDEGGTVHLWYSGDRENGGYLQWGPGSTEEARLIRYIAARLGPLPGWTMGYGFDITEDHTAAQINRWHDAMQAELGWFHYLGARTENTFLEDGLHRTTNRPMCENCDYESWVDHRPDYELYTELMDRNRAKPSFLEDRFRIRAENDIFRIKNYSMQDTRRGLWHGSMAGGAAAIWGNLIGSPAINTSAPYPDPAQLQTFGRFWEDRFVRGMYRCTEQSDGLCLKTLLSRQWVFYRENTNSIRMDLGTRGTARRAVAVDTKLAYAEIDLGELPAGDQVWRAPYVSDWAVAVGNFESSVPERAPVFPVLPELPEGPIEIFIPHPLNR